MRGLLISSLTDGQALFLRDNSTRTASPIFRGCQRRYSLEHAYTRTTVVQLTSWSYTSASIRFPKTFGRTCPTCSQRAAQRITALVQHCQFFLTVTLISRFVSFSRVHFLHYQKSCHNGEAVATNVHVVKRQCIPPKSSQRAVLHGTRAASNVKHVSSLLLIASRPRFRRCVLVATIGNTMLTLASYKDFSQDVFCKSKRPTAASASHALLRVF